MLQKFFFLNLFKYSISYIFFVSNRRSFNLCPPNNNKIFIRKFTYLSTKSNSSRWMATNSNEYHNFAIHWNKKTTFTKQIVGYSINEAMIDKIMMVRRCRSFNVTASAKEKQKKITKLYCKENLDEVSTVNHRKDNEENPNIQNKRFHQINTIQQCLLRWSINTNNFSLFFPSNWKDKQKSNDMMLRCIEKNKRNSLHKFPFPIIH